MTRAEVRTVAALSRVGSSAICSDALPPAEHQVGRWTFPHQTGSRPLSARKTRTPNLLIRSAPRRVAQRACSMQYISYAHVRRHLRKRPSDSFDHSATPCDGLPHACWVPELGERVAEVFWIGARRARKHSEPIGQETFSRRHAENTSMGQG